MEESASHSHNNDMFRAYVSGQMREGCLDVDTTLVMQRNADFGEVATRLRSLTRVLADPPFVVSWTPPTCGWITTREARPTPAVTCNEPYKTLFRRYYTRGS